jgi:putative transposase
MSTVSWHHSPLHIFIPEATYFVTARIYRRKFLIHTDDRKELLLSTNTETLKIHGYSLHAWAILSNHYHIVIQDICRKVDLTPLFRRIHSITAITLNRLDGTPGRKVWFQFWDKLI